MTNACPRCRRPVALARPTCLYCGAPLPDVALPAPASAAASEAAPEDDARTLVVADMSRADARALAEALALLPYEAEQRVRRPGWQLLRVGDALTAGESEALRRAGARLLELSAAETRAARQPQVVLGGAWREGRWQARTLSGATSVAPGELLLLVRGVITRQVRGEDDKRRRLSSVAPEPGLRVHLHRRDDARPLELDPHDFEFGREAPPDGPPLVTLLRWCETLAGGAAWDDGFRHVTPALAPALPPPRSAAVALAPSAGGARQPQIERLDNLAQFRAYSAWRAAVERRLAAPASVAP